ncbi:hypothetical protein HK101_004762 [Irineochytrium annulatum]|nr:hypothetical protein HK101_004762 [Irineochytrium annulatum]
MSTDSRETGVKDRLRADVSNLIPYLNGNIRHRAASAARPASPADVGRDLLQGDNFDRSSDSLYPRRSADLDDLVNGEAVGSADAVSSSQFTAAAIDKLEDERTRLHLRFDILKDDLTVVGPRLHSLHSANTRLTKLLDRSETRSSRLREALEDERSTAALLQIRTTEREQLERRFLQTGVERVRGEKESLEEELIRMGYVLDGEKMRVEDERKEVSRLRQDAAELKEELVQAGARVMEEEEEIRRVRTVCDGLRESLQNGEQEWSEVVVDVKMERKEKAEEQDILDLKHFVINAPSLQSAIRRELRKRNPAKFGYDFEDKTSIRGLQELCAGVLKMAAFKAEVNNTEYIVDVDLDVDGVHFDFSRRRDSLKRAHVVVTFMEKRTGDCVGRTIFELAVVAASAWYEKYFTPASPHNKHPFKLFPRLIQEPPSYLETLQLIQTESYRSIFADPTRTVHVVTGKGGKRYMRVEELIKGKKAAVENFRLQGKGGVITQRITIVQIVSSCIVEEVRE